ncbi:RNA chaperone ProQ [Motilimonas sp. 1_MG-2023]|uniref:RNA chaperone ProQ n=1 Tax=Motilimonas TaxID=1914248 RepID=UPI0026E27D61|nr:RNA chaperone ProQ [Motilimonas sp. 1_MG-2023]MDO6526222.1 RNA chaperone ProQ [Motilimonas sp. 1_MG-2023]
MENTEKLTNNKQIIAYLVEMFPLCFIAEGEAKPLKIGIFQDLAERLGEDDKVSKTQLRSALRQYTSSWRYLHGVKPGAKRVDLDGVEGDELEAEHIEHAQKALKESKAKVFAERKAAEKEKAAKNPAKKAPVKSAKPARSSKPKADKPAEKVTYVPAEIGQLKVAQEVKVIVGKAPVPATIVDINKDDVQVQLMSGMTLKVKAQHLIL